jgi:hypothetical protein
MVGFHVSTNYFFPSLRIYYGGFTNSIEPTEIEGGYSEEFSLQRETSRNQMEVTRQTSRESSMS